MRVTMLVAVFQAVSLAMAGSRLEPERKNRRVKVMNVKVTRMHHERSSHPHQWGSPILMYPHLIQALSMIKETYARNRFHRGEGTYVASSHNTATTTVLPSERTHSELSRQNLNTTMPTPFSPPQIRKFMLAPCHSPPSSMVIILFRLAHILRRRSGQNHAVRITATASRSTQMLTQMFPLSIRAERVSTAIQKSVPKLIFLFPPRGMYR